MNIALARPAAVAHEIRDAFFGSLFIALCSLIWIPTLPIAVTMQSFALLLLALTQSPRVCMASALFYLTEASLGLPVLCGCFSPFWYIGPSAGYLFAFPIAGYVMATFANSSRAPLAQFASLLLGQGMIYILGYAWLSLFIGPFEAFKWGVLFFLPADILKTLLAVQVAKRIKD